MAMVTEEHLSQLLDGELSSAECERVLDALIDDPQLQQKWQRLNMIRAGVEQNLPAAWDKNFSSSVMAAIADEPSYAPSSNNVVKVDFQRWLRPLAGLAIAASVAGVAIISMRAPSPLAAPPQIALTQAVLAPQSASVPLMNVSLSQGLAQQQPRTVTNIAPQSQVILVRDWNQLPRNVQKRLNSYIITHRSHGGELNPAMPANVRLIGFDEGR